MKIFGTSSFFDTVRGDRKLNRLMWLFAMEGILFQVATASNSYSNQLYATYLGATQQQIGLVSALPPLVACLVLLPIGVLCARCRSSRIPPVVLASFIGMMYLGKGSISPDSEGRLFWYFVFLMLTQGLVSAYTAQWQELFADAVPQENRNEVYGFRSWVGYPFVVLTPLLAGVAITALQHGALTGFRLIYYLNALFFLLQALVLSRVGVRQREKVQDSTLLRDIPDALKEMAGSRPFLVFLGTVLLFYCTWYLDYGTWYLAETLYGGMNERQLSYFSALYSLSQFLMMGVFTKMNRKYSVHYTILFGIAGLALCPLAVCLSPLAPVSARPWVFMLIGVAFNTTPGCIPLCILQMMLSVIPPKHRSLNISLYTMMTCALQAVIPYLGNALYRAMGENQRAMIQFYLLVMVLRIGAFVVFFVRYRRYKKDAEAESA